MVDFSDDDLSRVSHDWKVERERALIQFAERQARAAESREDFIRRIQAVCSALHAGQSSTAAILPNVMGPYERSHAAHVLADLVPRFSDRWE